MAWKAAPKSLPYILIAAITDEVMRGRFSRCRLQDVGSQEQSRCLRNQTIKLPMDANLHLYHYPVLLTALWIVKCSRIVSFVQLRVFIRIFFFLIKFFFIVLWERMSSILINCLLCEQIEKSIYYLGFYLHFSMTPRHRLYWELCTFFLSALRSKKKTNH